jgi:plasmid stabilization system protein ParE
VRRVRITGPAQRDIARALRRSSEDFGARARERYRRLLDQALRDLAEDPDRVGVRPIDDVRVGYFAYHLKSSTKGTPKPTVHQPRHLLAFYIDDADDVVVAHIFHERQMLSRHLVADSKQ